MVFWLRMSLQDIPVVIAPLGDNTFTLLVSLGDTTNSVRTKIEAITGLEPGSYELVYRLKKFDAGVSMAAYYLEPNCKIHLVPISKPKHLFIHLSINLFIHVFIHSFTYIFVFMYVSFHLFFVDLFIYLVFIHFHQVLKQFGGAGGKRIRADDDDDDDDFTPLLFMPEPRADDIQLFKDISFYPKAKHFRNYIQIKI